MAGNASPHDHLVQFAVAADHGLPAPVSSWGFATDVVTDDVNGCTGCANRDATWFAPSLRSGGFAFDGVSSHLDLGTFPYLDGRAAFSLAVWVRPSFDHTHGVTRYLFADGSNLSVSFLHARRAWRVVMRTASGTTYRLDTAGVTWLAGTWHLFTVTYDGVTLRTYWDGAPSRRCPRRALSRSTGSRRCLGRRRAERAFSGISMSCGSTTGR